jgi:glycosyltransferase involved in cell wall biosynthesis
VNVLFLSWWFPYPPNNGSRMRIYNLLRRLSRNHTVTLLTFSDDPTADAAGVPLLREFCPDVQVVPRIPFTPGRWQALRGFLSLWPRFFVESYSREMVDLVEHRAGAHDVVVASEVWMVRYALAAGNLPKVLEEMEVAHFSEGRGLRQDLFWQLRYGPMWWKFRRLVRRLAHQFDAITVVSDQEVRLLEEITPTHNLLTVVPNGVDLPLYDGDFGQPAPDALIFPGALTFYANYGAMDYFLREIYPLIRARRPQTALRITGKTDGVDMAALPACDGVMFTGYLDDIRPAVAQSWACVVPLKVGGGTRLKILESLALGTPVVSTSKGAEGLDVTTGEDILIADQPEDFADAVLCLLGDPALRAKLAANGRRLVEDRYSWDTCARELEHVLYQVLERAAG